MKIVVIGGTGLIGTKLVEELRESGHDVLAASPNIGRQYHHRRGLGRSARRAREVVVDVANSPSLEDKAVLEFFETSGRNLLAAEAAAGVRHHVALSVVGTERLPDSGYFRASGAGKLIKASGIPYTILRATQFFEFVGGIAQSGTDGDVIRLSPALFQPIASEDVAAALADLAVGPPVNGMVEVAGPEPIPARQRSPSFLPRRATSAL